MNADPPEPFSGGLFRSSDFPPQPGLRKASAARSREISRRRFHIKQAFPPLAFDLSAATASR